MRFENDKTTFHPVLKNLEPGTYYWCTCGKTRTVPFCDNAHENERWQPKPLEFEIEEPQTVTLCNCGRTGNPPYCDGSHSAIE